MTWNKIFTEYESNSCKLKCKLPNEIHNYKSCDLFIGENDVLFCSGSTLFRHINLSKIDTKDLQKVQINYNTKTNMFTFQLPCLPDESLLENSIKLMSINVTNSEENNYSPAKPLVVSELTRITDFCSLEVDGKSASFEQKFGYGFGCRLQDDTSLVESTLKDICKVDNPSKHSILSRRFQRETDEVEHFSKDQYKLNFIELDIPGGLDNPLEFTFNYGDNKLSKNQENILQNLCLKKLQVTTKERTWIECGLIDILLAICYDVRSTQNDQTCESAWTRTILSPSLSYFEPVDSLKSVIQIFLRRSLIYPLYRNYDFSQVCLRDAIDALQKGPKWILKQFLITYELFLSSDDSRQLLNKYFIEDYIRYLSIVVAEDELVTLSFNVKNASLNITKKDLQLDLKEIETEILRELIHDMHLGHSDDSDDDESNESDKSKIEDDDGDDEGSDCESTESNNVSPVVSKKNLL